MFIEDLIMTNAYIDEQTYDVILTSLKEAGINEDIIKTASTMDLDIVRLFYEKLVVKKNAKNVEVVVKSLLGVYGNYLASCYYKGIGFAVEREVKVTDTKGDNTKADLLVTDKDGNKIYCEVKATSQIIGSSANYVDLDDKPENRKNKLKRYQEVLTYKSIGTKLIKQVKRLRSTGDKVNVVVFSNCQIDDVIKAELEALNVDVVRLLTDVKLLENALLEMVNKFIMIYKNVSPQNIASKNKD